MKVLVLFCKKISDFFVTNPTTFSLNSRQKLESSIFRAESPDRAWLCCN